MTAPTLDDVRAENRSEAVGPIIYELVMDWVSGKVRNYPDRYFTTGDRTADLDDITHETFQQLLGSDGGGTPLATILERSDDIGDFRRQVRTVVGRVMRKRLRTDSVDNLLTRVRSLVTEPPFMSSGSGFDTEFWLEGADMAAVDMTGPTLARAVSGLAAIQKQSPERGIYSRENLVLLLRRVVGNLGCRVTIRGLEKILNTLLTDFVPRDLVHDVETELRDPSVESVTSGLEITETVDEILTLLDPDAAELVRLLLAGHTVVDIAGLTGVTRQTVHNRLNALKPVLLEGFRELVESRIGDEEDPDIALVEVVRLLGTRLTDGSLES